MQTRKVFAGLTVAGALTLWAGASAFAFDGDRSANETLAIQAQAAAEQTEANIMLCAANKLVALLGQTAPSGVNAEAWAGAQEAATNKVDALQESWSNKVEAQTEAFENSLESDDEDGTQAPANLDALTATLTQLQTQACQEIAAVTVHVPTPVVKPPKHDRDDEADNDSEHHDSDTEHHSPETEHSND